MVAGATWEPQPMGRAALLWGGAALVAILGHGGAVWYALQQPELESAPASPPPAVMIEMAPEVVAPVNDTTEHSRDLLDVEEVEAPETLTQPEMPTMVEDQLTPETDFTPMEPLPEMEQVALPPTVIPEAVVPPPPRRPERPPPVEAERTAETARPPAPQQEQRAARSETAAPAPTAAAPRSGAGTTGSVSPARWQSRLMAHLERRKRYPSSSRSRREEGIAYVQFVIDEAGNVLSAQLVRSSGYSALDAAGLSLVQRASPVPAPPPGVSRSITAPINFNIR